MNWLISYPRSGNTAARYLIELMTRKPTNGVCFNAPLNDKDVLQKPLLHKSDAPQFMSHPDYIMRKNHSFKGVEKEDFVLFIIRDYLECIVRHNEKRGLTEENLKAWIDGWFHLLKLYHLHPGPKMLFYYDELVKVASKESRDIYPNPQSTGSEFHRAKIGDKLCKKLDGYAQKNYADLYKTYL